MVSSLRVPRRLTLVSLLSLVGAGSAAYLSQLYYSLRDGTAGFKSICSVNATMNCNAVAASSYAELFQGLPLSSLAAGAMLAIFFVSILARNHNWRRDSIRTAFVLSLVSALFGVFYFIVMAVVLKTFCLFCLFVDVAGLGSLFLLISLKPEPLSRAPFAKDQIPSLIGIPIATLLITVLALKGLDILKVPNSSLDEIATSLLLTPPVAVNVGPEHPSLGEPTAPVTVVEFSDFQCPHCRNGAHILNAVKARYPGQVRIVYRGYPLDPGCNRKMQGAGGHTVACEAAKAALCSQAQGKFEAYYEKTFENQESIIPGKPIEFAKSLPGIDAAVFDTCMVSAEIATRVSQDIEEGIQLGVESTPTFFLNGRKIDGAYPVPIWNRMVDRLLASSSGK